MVTGKGKFFLLKSHLGLMKTCDAENFGFLAGKAINEKTVVALEWGDRNLLSQVLSHVSGLFCEKNDAGWPGRKIYL